MAPKQKKTLDEVEFKDTIRKVYWICRRPTTIFLKPDEDFSYGDHEIYIYKHQFNKQLAYHLDLEPESIQKCIQEIYQIMNERKLFKMKEKTIKLTKWQIKMRNRNENLEITALLLMQGFSNAVIKQFLGVPQSLISDAQRRIRSRLPLFICKRGRSEKLSEQEIQMLQNASQNNELENLTCNKIQEQILLKKTKEEGKLHNTTLSRILKRKLHLSYKQYCGIKEKTNAQNSIIERQDYAQHIIPVLKNKLTIIFIDETSIWSQNSSCKSWLPIGEKRMKSMASSVQKYSIIGAVSETQIEGYMIVEDGMLSEQYMGFIAELVLNLEASGRLRQSLLVVDNAQHNSGPAWSYIYEYLPILFLPPYSPQLNQIELIWSLLKRKLSRMIYDDEPEMMKSIHTAFKSIKSEHIQKLFNHTLRYVNDSINLRRF